MAFEKIGEGEERYFKYNDCKPGQILVTGVFLEKKLGKYGDQYYFMAEDQVKVVLNRSTDLQKLMELVKPNDRVRVTYSGSKPITGGKYAGGIYHKFSVEKDNDSQIPADQENPDIPF